MTYLLDTMVVSFFLEAGRDSELAVASAAVPMAVADEVRRELLADRNRGGKPFMKWWATTKIDVLSISLGTAEAATLTALLSPASPQKNLGERASIALAAFRPTLTFVSHDKNGIWIGLREIWEPGERLMGVPVFLRRLWDAGAVSNPAVLDDIISQLDQAHRPTWWASWRAGLVTANAPAPQLQHAPPAVAPQAQSAQMAAATVPGPAASNPPTPPPSVPIVAASADPTSEKG